MSVRIGELLVERGVASPAQVEAALHEGRARPLPLASRLLEAGLDEGALASVLAELHGLPGVDLSRTAIDLGALAEVPREVAEQDLILPLSLDGERLHLAMADPLDQRIVAEVRFVTGREVSVYAVLRGALERAIEGAYAARARGEACWRGAAAGPELRLGVAVPTPAAPGAPADVAEPEAPEPVTIEVEEPVAASPVQGRPLALVVDDEPEIRRLVERTLAARGWTVEQAGDGEEAVARAEALVPDVVLLDAMLPRLHGFEACRRLRASPRTRDVPVVIMTAVYRGWRFAQDARENLGARDYLEKPFRLDELVRRVEAAREASAVRPPPEAAAGPHLVRGRELLAAGCAAEAAAELAEAVRDDPWSAEAHYQLGRALQARGDAFAAMTALERASELRPGHLAALRALAAVCQQKGFRRKAAEALERAMGGAAPPARYALRRELLRLLG